jgi:hypothetical protein
LTAAESKNQELKSGHDFSTQHASELQRNLAEALSALERAREEQAGGKEEGLAALEACKKSVDEELACAKEALGASEEASASLRSDLEAAQLREQTVMVELKESEEEAVRSSRVLQERLEIEAGKAGKCQEEVNLRCAEAEASKARLSEVETELESTSLREKELRESIQVQLSEVSDALKNAIARATAAEDVLAEARSDAEANKAALDQLQQATNDQADEAKVAHEGVTKSVEELQVRERKLKSLLAKQKSLIKAKEEEAATLRREARAGGDSQRSAMELSAELKSRGEALRRATDEVDSLKQGLSVATKGRSEAEGLLEATRRSLEDSQAKAADASHRCVAAETKAQDLRTQFDE